jgi:hypothetical protein
MQRNRLRALRDRYRPRVILAESNSLGGPMLEQLRLEGLRVRGFTTANSTKARIVSAVQLAFEKGTIKIPDNPVLIGELQAFQAKTLPSGFIRYEAQENCHDDTVIAFCLAWEARRLSAPYDPTPARIAASHEFVQKLYSGRGYL